MANVRMVYPKTMSDVMLEMHKIDARTDTIQNAVSKVFSLCMFIEDIPNVTADFIKQAMMNAGGNAVIFKYSNNDSLENANLFIMGNLDQLNSIIKKLMSQSEILSAIGSKMQFVLQATEKKETLSYYRCGKHKLEIGKKTYIMGILNITTDSFSGDGLLSEEQNMPFNEVANKPLSRQYIEDSDLVIDAACCRAEKMVKDGADIIDVGGESTRPGYAVVDEKEELNRIIGVVERLVKTLNVPISVDTSKSYVAEHVLKAGAHIINDVNGLIKDPKISTLAASYGAGVIAMHNTDKPLSKDIFSCIIKSLRKSVDIAVKSGLSYENVLLDPGIGFGKTLEQNLEVMHRLDELKCLGYPILLGTSRKSMIGKVLNLPVNERIEGTAATVALGIAKGVDFIRVHDVNEMCKVAKMSDAMIRGIM